MIRFMKLAKLAGVPPTTLSGWITRGVIPSLNRGGENPRNAGRYFSRQEAALVLLFTELTRIGLAPRYAHDVAQQMTGTDWYLPGWVVIAFAADGRPSSGNADSLVAAKALFEDYAKQAATSVLIVNAGVLWARFEDAADV